MQPILLTVAVLTYRRPAQLAASLPLIARQVTSVRRDHPDVASAEVLVIDNDPDASARQVATAGHSTLVRYVVEPKPGISAGRNRALDECADADILVYIDDDERPTESWLRPLVDTWQQTRAAAVMGRVVSEFEVEPDPWLAAGSFFTRRTMPTGTRVQVAAAGNLLLDLNQVRTLGVRFHDDFGLTGGEDTLFSRELVRAGGSIVWCDESVAIDHVPAERITRRWALRRAWSHGNTASVIEAHLARGKTGLVLARIRGAARGAARVLGGAGRYLFGVLVGNLRHQARGLRTAYRGAGMLGGALGTVYREYARTD